MHTPRLGRPVFAMTMVALGIFGLLHGDFTPIWTGVPQAVPAREILAYLCAFISLATGIGLLWQRTAFIASSVLLGYLLLWLLLLRGSRVLLAPGATDSWWACGETAVLAAAAWVLTVRFAEGRQRSPLRLPTGDQGRGVATRLFGLGLIPFGIAHFTYLDRTVAMVPGWLPGHLPWAVFTGCAFIAEGTAVLIGPWARLAATLSALQLALFTFLVWGPVVLAGPSKTDWTEIVVSWTLTTAAWVVADSYHDRPWLPVASARAA